MINSKITTSEAIARLRSDLEKDSAYRQVWESTISIALIEEFRLSGISFPDLNKVCDRAALRFLNLLCSKTAQIGNRLRRVKQSCLREQLAQALNLLQKTSEEIENLLLEDEIPEDFWNNLYKLSDDILVFLKIRSKK
jgi:hypothetical protein